MQFLYFFNRGCPQILHEKFESVPSANDVATPIFTIFAVSQFTLSRGKIRLCTSYTFFIGGVHRYCTRNWSPFRLQTSSLRLFSRFFPVSQFILSRGKIRLCTSYTFSSRVSIDTAGGGIGGRSVPHTSSLRRFPPHLSMYPL